MSLVKLSKGTHAPWEYSLEVHSDAENNVPIKKHVEKIKRILKSDAKEKPNFFDGTIKHTIGAAIPGAVLGGLEFGLKGAAKGGLASGVLGGLLLNKIKYENSKKDVSTSKEMLKMKDLDKYIANEYLKKKRELNRG